MLRDELLAQVKALKKEEKLELLQTLLNDPDLAEHAYDPLGIRSNYRAAEVLMKLFEEEKAKTQLEAE